MPHFGDHPEGLRWLFLTEAAERFGYYGMRALLALYLVEHFMFGDYVVAGIYGAFTSLVYLTPLFGGLVADRLLGGRKSIRIGIALMALGYFVLCFGGEQARPTVEIDSQTYSVERMADNRADLRVTLPNGPHRITIGEDAELRLTPVAGRDLGQVREIQAGQYRFDGQRSQQSVALLLLALSLIIVGTGLFKPNIATLLGRLYVRDPSLRDAGFTIFYMGINLGSLLAQFLCPIVAQAYGWAAGFSLACIGLAGAYFIFSRKVAEPDDDLTIVRPAFSIQVATIFAIVASVPIAWILLNNSMASAAAANGMVRADGGLADYLAGIPWLGRFLLATFTLAVIGLPIWAARSGTREEWQRMTVAVVLTVFAVAFFTLLEQAGSSLTLFAERNTDRQIGGYLMPAGQVQIFNPLFVIVFAPIIGGLWSTLAARGRDPSVGVKFAMGLVLVGLGFLLLSLGAGQAGPDFRVALWWLAASYLLQSVGELCLSPVGLSTVSRMAMARVAGLMMGVWYLAQSMAQFVGGAIAQMASTQTIAGQVANPALSLRTYAELFWTVGLSAVGIGGLALALAPWLRRWMHQPGAG